MNGYRFDVNCRYCGGGLVPVNEGRPSSFYSCAVAKCSECNTTWLVRVEMVTDTPPGRCKVTPAKLAGLARARDMKVALNAV